ncbi:MAG: hydrogenase maturation nickel metallochaperone HypA [Deltaproteobacteria bacterium]|nr:hydrogenase maturation nickel metallochaperone HypA [Deltaproteobacteria bacterium]
MHEAHLMKDLINKIISISKENASCKVTKIKVKLGALSHMTPEHFKEHFDQVAVGTCAQDAVIEAQQAQDIHDANAQGILLESFEIEES